MSRDIYNYDTHNSTVLIKIKFWGIRFVVSSSQHGKLCKLAFLFYRIYEFINITQRGVFPIKNKRAPVPKISKWSRFRKISLCNKSLLVDCLIMFSFWLLTKHIDITSGNSITCTCTLFKIMIVCENGQIIAVMKSVIKFCNPKSDCWNQVQYMIH